MKLIYKKITALMLALTIIMTVTVSATAASRSDSVKAVSGAASTTAKSSAKKTSGSTTANSSTKKASSSTTAKSSTQKASNSTTAKSSTQKTTTTTAYKEPETLEVPEVPAKSAVVMDCDTGAVLYALNENDQLPMASTTKIMTCILSLESGDIGRTITFTEECTEMLTGTRIGLEIGDKISMYDLCVAMMMYSGNDAANAAAVAVSGTVQEFVSKMNEKACELGMLNTHFDTPSGLDEFSDGAHYSSAYDMALLGRYAMQNPDFRDIVNFKVRSIYYNAYPKGRNLITHNYLLQGQSAGYKGCDGIKTGVTERAGECLVSHVTTAEGTSLVCVTLHDNSRWQTHRNLYNYTRSLYTKLPVDTDISEFKSTVVGGTSKSVAVSLKCGQNEMYNLLKTQKASVKRQIVCDKFLYAPIQAGDVVGYVQYTADGVVVAKYPIVAEENVEATTGGWFSEYMQAIRYSSQNGL